MLRPAATASRTRIASPSRSAFSWIRTASAPSGTGAPVKMRTASPGPSAPAKRSPARDMPTTLSRAPDCRLGGAHGVAVHGGGGEGRLRQRRAARSSASTRPDASASGTVSAGKRLDAGEKPRDRLVDREQAHRRRLGPPVAGAAAGLLLQPDVGDRMPRSTAFAMS